MYPFQRVYERLNSKLYPYDLEVGFIEVGYIDEKMGKIDLEQATLKKSEES